MNLYCPPASHIVAVPSSEYLHLLFRDHWTPFSAIEWQMKRAELGLALASIGMAFMKKPDVGQALRKL